MMKPLLGLTLTLALTAGVATGAQAQMQSFEQLERGRYLTTLSDCAACHTAPGGKPFAGGLALQTPFGKLVAPNITPDNETGIGAWTAEQFYAAMHDGIGRHGEHLYPAMPYTAYTKLSRDEVEDIRSYLSSVPPVHNEVVANQLPFPFNQRIAMMGWNWLNFTPGEFKPDRTKSDEWNRGAFIVDGPGHCAACHSPKTFLGGDKSGSYLQGAVLQNWYAPNLTGNTYVGIGGWSNEEIVQYLKTGANAHGIASGPMGEEIANSSSHMGDADLKAIAVYLKDQAPAGPAKPQAIAASDPAMVAGKAIYEDSCAACHKFSGDGDSHIFPKLSGTSVVQAPDATTLVRVVLQGAKGVATAGAPTAPSMPSFDWRFNDAQAAAVLTYIRNSWGNAAPAVSAEQVKSLRKEMAIGG